MNASHFSSMRASFFFTSWFQLHEVTSAYHEGPQCALFFCLLLLLHLEHE